MLSGCSSLIFSDSDIRIISTVDAAKFTQAGLKPKDVMNFLFRMDTEKELSNNKFAMGLVCNKLLLAYKNKPGFLKELVMKAQPSLTSILTNIKRTAKEKNFATPEMMAKNQEDYVFILEEIQRSSSRSCYSSHLFDQSHLFSVH